VQPPGTAPACRRASTSTGTIEPGTLFFRNLMYDEFDVFEMSISETLLAIERRDVGRWDWSALPVFLSRGHHWPNFWVNTASGISGLADIRGKRIGVPDYDMTAALWFRITLKDLCGIEAGDNIWFNGRTKSLSHAGALGLDKEGPRSVEHHWLSADETLDQMLDRGELDLVTAIRPQPRATAGDATVIDRWGGTQLAGNPRLRKLFPDDGKTVVFDYYRKTGFFQPNHHVIVQNRILKEHPWVALELYDAFRRSKEIAYDRASGSPGRSSIFLVSTSRNKRRHRRRPVSAGACRDGQEHRARHPGLGRTGPAAAPFVTRRYILPHDAADLSESGRWMVEARGTSDRSPRKSGL
jgi:hypothetical protein